LVVASWLPVGQKSEAREDGRPEISMLAIWSDDLDHTSTFFAPPLFPHGDINWNPPYFWKALDPRIIPFARCGWKRDLKQICSLRRTTCNRQLDLEISVRPGTSSWTTPKFYRPNAIPSPFLVYEIGCTTLDATWLLRWFLIGCIWVYLITHNRFVDIFWVELMGYLDSQPYVHLPCCAPWLPR
jgi:hypothetical protein